MTGEISQTKLTAFAAGVYLLLGTLALATTTHGQVEPTVKLEVISNGLTRTINDGDTLTLGGEETIIRTLSVKTFAMEGLRFDFPRDYAYKHQVEKGFRSWTFDGNNFVIMLFEFSGKTDVADFTREMVKKFGRKNCTVSPKTIRLGQTEINGTRIHVALLGSRLTFDLFPLSVAPEKGHIIAFQDTKSDGNEDSSEGIDTLDLICRTIEFK
jgi:hypothetical protein